MSKPATAKREVVLPEGLDGAELLPKDVRDKMVQDYVVKQREKFEKRIEARASRYEEKLLDKASNDREVILRQIFIKKAQAEIKEKRETMKQLRDEIKAIREEARKSKKGKTPTKKAS